MSDEINLWGLRVGRIGDSAAAGAIDVTPFTFAVGKLHQAFHGGRCIGVPIRPLPPARSDPAPMPHEQYGAEEIDIHGHRVVSALIPVRPDTLRPATVCGFSPRMRLDVSVNMLTMQALTNGKMTVFGGEQTRPNIHIQDITDLYIFLLDHPEHTGVYNAGFENLSILEIANLVAANVDAEIVVTPSNDPRSYRVNSDKLLATGFRPKYSVEAAIKEMVGMYRQGALTNEDRYYNLKWMQQGVAP